MPRTHVPVLAGELIEALDPHSGQVAVDCTVGAGGHGRLVADRLGPSGLLVGIDRDPLAEEAFAELAAEVSCRTRFLRADFAHGLETLRDEGFEADLVYLDLGMSSMQVDTRERGFSYAYDAPLDMRMDPSQTLTAAEIVNTWERRQLARTLREYGEERYAERIAREIVRRRELGPLATTFELVDAITAAIPAPARFGGGHPAKRSFQAIRIAVNARARAARRRAAAGVGGPAPRGPAGRDLLPLARGPPRQALPRRPRARLHLPARPARLRLRAHAGGRARVPPLRRGHAGRGRREPAREVRAPARRPQAPDRERCLMAAATARERHAARTRIQRAPAAPAAPGLRRHPVADGSGPQAVPAPRPGTGVFERLRGLPDHRVIDRLLRGRVWICFVGLALMGIVAMQVSLLKLNSGIGRAVETTGTLERQNSQLEASIARLASGERIRAAADKHGMVTPAAGAVHFLHVRPGQDASRAARRMRAPSEAARELMANARRRARLAGRAAGDDHDDHALHRGGRRTRGDARRPGGDAGAHACGGHAGAAGAHGHRPDLGRHRRRGSDPAAGLAPRAADRAADRPPLRRLPRHARARRPARRLARRRARRRAAQGRRHAADGQGHRPRRARRDHRPQRDRARRLPARDDRRGDAVPGQGPGQGRRQARAPAAHARGRAAAPAHSPRHRLRLPRPPRARDPRAPRRADEDRGARVHPRAPPHLPARLPRLPADRRRRHRGHRPVGARVLARRPAARPRRRAPAGQGRARRGDRAARDASHQARLADHAHDRRGDPGQGRGGARGRRRDLAPARRHGDRHGPAHRRAARARQLAARRRQQAGPRPRLRAPEPRRRHDLRAGLDLQAVHRRGRARGAGGHAARRSSTCRRRSASTTARSASRTRAVR